MITQSPVYKGIKSSFLYLSILAYFITFLAPYVLQIPQVVTFLNRTRLIERLSGSAFWYVVGGVGILYGLDMILLGYQGVTTHYLGRYTGTKAELRGIINIIIGIGIIIFCVNLIIGWWGRLIP